MNETTHRQSLAALTLGAIGVVYGDIGTSPLYTMKEVFGPGVGIPLDAAHIVGAVSTIFWGLMFVVTLKYVLLILRADNRGEGGIMALTALAVRSAGSTPARRHALLLCGVCGAALFYGDSVITPAISVLGAAEGLEVVAPSLKPWVLPISVGVLLGLFLVQRFGTQRVGGVFGPVIVLWFATLASTGAWQIAQAPAILQALDPRQAFSFLQAQGSTAPVHRRRCDRPGSHRPPRRSMRTWATSGRSRSASPGSAWCCPPWRSTTWARARS